MLDMWRVAGPVQPLREAIAQIILGRPEFWEPWILSWTNLPGDAMSDPTACLLDRDDITDRIGEIKAPAIVFHGTADAAIDLERARIVAAKLQNCQKLVEVPGAGHAANVTHPDVVNGPLLEFLREYA